ncbi:MAG TPA: hypothetical protein VK878_08250 [Candidatus Deferrimicrobiaceae bacterium]|nr:hypothetical protein [Candidatus Deferrimicrobiaceae bacterium]
MPSSTERLAGPACTLAWGAALVVLFLLNRRYDLAHLPAWLAAFGRALIDHSPIGTDGLVQASGGVIVAGLVVAAWWGLGSFILRLLLPSSALGSRALDWSARGLLGAGAWSTIWFFLGLAKLYHAPAAAAAVGVGLVLALRAWRRDQPVPQAEGPRPRAAPVLIALVLGLGLLAAIAPPTANDALMYHLALPKAFLGSGGLVEVPYNMASYVPLGVEMEAVWAMLLGRVGGARMGEVAAGATLAAFGPLLVLVTYGWARARRLDRTWSALAALAVASIPSVYFVVAGQGVDVAVAGYSALALLAAGRWWATLESRWLGLLAAAVGFALSAKLSAAALIVPLTAAVLIRGVTIERDGPSPDRPSGGAVAMRGLCGLGAGILLASPWYARTLIWTGSPLFPFYSTLWPGHAPGWDRGRAELLDALLQVYGRSSSVLDYVLSPFTVSILAQPELPRHYEGVLGPAFLIGAPLVIWAFRRRHLDPDLRLATVVAGGMLVLWLLGSQVVRYLLAAMPPLAIAIAAAGAAATATWGARPGRLLRGLLLGAAVANALVAIAWFAELNPLPVVLGGETRERFLSRRLDSFPYYETINRDLPPGARVWLIDTQRDTYHLERPYFADYLFGTYTIAQWIREAADVAEVRARARALGITHLFLRHDRLLDYATSAVVDDAQPREVNLARLRMLRAFIFQGSRLVQDGQKFWLVELPPAPGYKETR